MPVVLKTLKFCVLIYLVSISYVISKMGIYSFVQYKSKNLMNINFFIFMRSFTTYSLKKKINFNNTLVFFSINELT